MFNSHTLPPPSSFMPDIQPLRLTANPSPSLPRGGCRFILLHPSIQNQRCSCQSFHLNKSIPGSSCDCGHQACYHVHNQPEGPIEAVLPNSALSMTLQTALERIRKLEEAVQEERKISTAAILEERQARERDIRVIREAMHPFYRTEEEVRRKLVEIEDRMEGNWDEHCRLSDRLISIDDNTMSLERRLEEIEGSKPKRRRISRQIDVLGSPPDRDRTLSTTSLTKSPDLQNLSSTTSGSISPRESMPPPSHYEEPRSSGILDTSRLPAPPPYASTPAAVVTRSEPRSSGILNLSLNSRLAGKAIHNTPVDHTSSSESIRARAPYNSPYDAKQPLHIVSMLVQPRGNENTPLTAHDIINDSPMKRKREHTELSPLDILAGVGAASGMA